MALEASNWATPLPWQSVAPQAQATLDLSIWPYLFQLVLVTAVVAGLGLLSARFWRQRIPGLMLRGRERPVIEIVDRLAIDALRSLLVVRVGQRYWLLASSGERITPVTELQAEDVAGAFSEHLAREQQVTDEQ